MDARRFDRNADQLSQIIAHIRQVPQHLDHRVMMRRHRMLKALEKALEINDLLGKDCERGLI